VIFFGDSDTLVVKTSYVPKKLSIKSMSLHRIWPVLVNLKVLLAGVSSVAPNKNSLTLATQCHAEISTTTDLFNFNFLKRNDFFWTQLILLSSYS
jgi:hypothetical protein